MTLLTPRCLRRLRRLLARRLSRLSTNSIQHAGRGVTRELVLRLTGKEVKVVIQDNGKGLRLVASG
jgi:anti-sigma regulatory factor (Ser/Thr protein kinase)